MAVCSDKTNELVSKRGAVSLVVWKCFGFATSDVEQAKARCKICLKFVATKGSSTTNLFQHLKQNHVVEWEACVALRAKQDSGSPKTLVHMLFAYDL
ncbi:E3 SUMO-protein ligase ZBED1-like [Tachysurus ichikawai]